MAPTDLTTLVLPLSGIASLLIVGATYGRINTRVEDTVQRINKLEEAIIKRDRIVEDRLDAIHELLTDIRIAIAHRKAPIAPPSLPNNHHHEEE